MINTRRDNVKLASIAFTACLALAVLTVAMVVRSRDLKRINDLLNSTNAALCTFRADLEGRSDATAAFIEQHPTGIPGISRIDLERSLASQRATLSSLKNLDCK